MSSPTPGSDPNYPQGGAPQGQPGWGTPPSPEQGYTPAPSYSAPPAGYGATGQRPGMVTAAGIIGIVWGALGLLLGLLAMTVAFSLFGGIYGLLVLLSMGTAGRYYAAVRARRAGR